MRGWAVAALMLGEEGGQVRCRSWRGQEWEEEGSKLWVGFSVGEGGEGRLGWDSRRGEGQVLRGPVGRKEGQHLPGHRRSPLKKARVSHPSLGTSGASLAPPDSLRHTPPPISLRPASRRRFAALLLLAVFPPPPYPPPASLLSPSTGRSRRSPTLGA